MDSQLPQDDDIMMMMMMRLWVPVVFDLDEEDEEKVEEYH